MNTIVPPTMSRSVTASKQHAETIQLLTLYLGPNYSRRIEKNGTMEITYTFFRYIIIVYSHHTYMYLPTLTLKAFSENILTESAQSSLL